VKEKSSFLSKPMFETVLSNFIKNAWLIQIMVCFLSVECTMKIDGIMIPQINFYQIYDLSNHYLLKLAWMISPAGLGPER